MDFNIFFFKNNNGDCPPEMFINNTLANELANRNSLNSKDLGEIGAKWKHAIEKNGIPDNKYLDTTPKYNFFRIKIKIGRILIRFPYYLDSTLKRIIILCGYIKYHGYKKQDKKINKAIDKEYQKAQSYWNVYHNNKNCYKNSELIKLILNELPRRKRTGFPIQVQRLVI